uniref:Ig-like domain-containing protein n=1 Tax=Nothoprocta perdicaria TaxID=30464 RepID=A0A8C6Z7I2_NOTPE
MVSPATPWSTQTCHGQPHHAIASLAASTPLAAEPHTLHLFLTLAFQNTTVVDVGTAAELDGVAFAALHDTTRDIIYQRPWVSPALPAAEWQQLGNLFKIYVHNLILLLEGDATQHGEPYPFVYQNMVGCELYSNGSSTSFCYLGYNGQDLIVFDVDEAFWVRQRGDALATRMEETFNSLTGVSAVLQELLNFTCVEHMRSLLQSGQKELQRQVQPMAVVFARQEPNSSQLLLVCRVTGFYPSAVRVSWLRDGHEVAPQPGPGSSPLLPNADLTYQLRRAVAAAPGTAHGYACRVQHSSLGGRDLLLPWGG